jgi:prepilin-type N-terminal cleavage/methylation domain-containing protein
MFKVRQKGFTLVEIAVVLVIIGLLAAGSLSLLSEQRKSVKIKESDLKVQQIKEALLNFVKVNGYLPCADSSSNPDGKEDRNTTNGTCNTVVGNVPYQDIGLSVANVKDSYNNFIRYAINTDTQNTADICDASKSASYFCNQSAPRFTLSTPPTQAVASSGDYTICNDNYSGSSCTNASDIALAQASAVIVAYNQDGLQQLKNCNSMPAKEKENCNVNQYYVSATYNGKQANFFDDNVIGITGYEIKNVAMGSGLLAGSLGTQSNSGNGTITGANFSIPDIQNPDQTINGDLDDKKDLSLSNSGDSVLITGNVNDKIDLKNGTNQLQVDGDVNDKIKGGKDQDTLRVGGNLNGKVDLKKGDDHLEVYGDVNRKIDMGDGSDIVYVHGNVNAEIKMGKGDDKLRIDGAINHLIKGGDGTDELFVDYTTAEWNGVQSWQQSFVSSFERIFCTDGQCN